jgi:hypothetical protein
LIDGGKFSLPAFGRVAKIVLAGVVVFLFLSIFSSDPSPDTESRNPADESCRSDWKKCGSDNELLRNWNYELKKAR